MARIAYLLLCHKDPEGVIAQAKRLTAHGDFIAIHYDARAPKDDFRRITAALAGNRAAVVVRRRVRCGWGEWSLVEGTLRALTAAEAAFPAASHFYLLSGDCMPIKTARHVHAFLDAGDADYIESFDFFTSDWIKTGLKEDRLVFRHPFNERRQKRLFYGFYETQKKLGLRRRIPEGLQVMIGSQWWCLRRQTIEKVLAFMAARPDVRRFFRTTWIPDETFFQTLVRHLVPADQIRSRTPTFLMFTDYGMPVTFHNDHHDLLLSQDFLFARKISGDATWLKDRLGALYGSDAPDPQPSGEGRGLYGFIAGRGRIGRRFAPRAWEAGSALGREREILVIVCKKWHVAKRLAELIAAETGIPALHYLFTEEDTPVPDLGGIEKTLSRRTRHRRAVLGLICRRFGSDRLAFCLDPAQFEVLADLHADRATVRVLQVDCRMDDAYLAGHLRRVGLVGPATPAATLDRLLPTARNDIGHEVERIRDAGFPHLLRLAESAGLDENAETLARFLSLPHDKAARIAAAGHLFSD